MDLTRQAETMIDLLSSDHSEEDDHYQKFQLSRGSCSEASSGTVPGCRRWSTGVSTERHKQEVNMKLNELKENQNAVVAKLDGDNRFISRITSIGLTPGCRLQVVKNDRNRPVLVYSRDTMIALNRKECSGIEVTEV